MATLNLGRIKPVFRGAYSGSTAYVVDDIVTHGNESFICIQAHGAGTQATSVTAYWTKLAAKGADGTDIGTTLTTQGDILFRDGSGLQRLAKGTAAQTLAINSGATAPEWVDASGGKTLQVVSTVFVTGENINNGNFGSTWREFATNPMIQAITPQKTTSKMLVSFQPHIFGHNNSGTTWDSVRARLMYKYSTSSPTSYSEISNAKGDGWFGTIAAADYSGYSGGHWIHHKPTLEVLHDHDTPAGETLTYNLYIRSANTGSSYDWTVNLFTNTGTGENGVGRIIITELDI